LIHRLPQKDDSVNNENKQRTLKTILYYIVYAGLGLSVGVLGPSLLRLADNTGTTIGQVSAIFLFHSLGYLLGAVIGGRSYDRIAGHPIMSLMLVFMAITLAITPIINVLWLLSLVMLLFGIAQGALDVGDNALLLWTYGSKVGPYMNGLHLFFGIGAFLAPVLVAQSVSVGDSLNLAYWGMAAFMLIPAVGLLFMRSPLKTDGPNDAAKSSGRSNALLLGMIVVFLVFYIGMEHGITGWIFTYATTSNLLNEASAAYVTSLFWGAFTLGRVLSIPIAIKIRPRQVLTIDLLGCFTSILILLIWPGSVTALWISIAATGFFAAPLFPTIITFAENRMHLTGKSTSLFFVGVSIGGMFFPWLIGQCYESVGPRMVPFTIITSATLMIGLFVLLVKKYPGKILKNGK
jgi:MFS transporter, FHS family, Na+ dependent glucose transporter 1